MDVEALDLHQRGGGVEVFALIFAHAAAVHRVGEVRAEALDVKVVRALADLLVGGEAHANFAVLQVGVGHKELAQGHDLGDARLVVAAQQGGAVGDDQLVAHVTLQTFKFFRLHDHTVAHVQLAAGIHQAAGMHRAGGHGGGGVHMGDQADGGLIGHVGGNFRIDVAGGADADVLRTHFLQFLFQQSGHIPLFFGGGMGSGGFAGAGVDDHIVEKPFFHIHGTVPP